MFQAWPQKWTGFIESPPPGILAYRPDADEVALLAFDATNQSSWSTTPSQTFRSNANRAADLNNDGFVEIVLASYEENFMTVVWGQRDNSSPPTVTQYPIGPGPLGAEPVLREGTSNTLLVPRIGWNATTGTALAEVALFNLDTGQFSQVVQLDPEAGRASLYTTASVPPVGTGPNWYALTWAGAHSGTSAACNSDVEPTVEFLTVGSTDASLPGLHKVSDVTLKRGMLSSIGVHLTGFAQNPWFVFSNPDDPIVEVAQPGAPDTILHTFADPVLTIAPFPRATDDAVLITFGDGARGGIYQFAPATGFTLLESLTPPPGEKFAALLAMNDGRIFSALQSGADPTRVVHAIYENNGDGFRIASSGSDVVFSSYPATTTVKLFTDDPFGTGGFEFEDFSAGHWATNSLFDGTNIAATKEQFDGTAAGLGTSMPVQLTPANDPGANAKALANQWGDAGSSLFFLGAPSAKGSGAAVTISPPPGTYSSTIHINFSANPGTSVAYRQSGGPWQAAPAGGFFVASNTNIEYYGQSASGAFSPIKSAPYQIDLSFAPNASREWIPPDIALAFGINPGDGPDLDGDGFSNTEEILAGTDLHSANSFPSNSDYQFPPPLTITVQPKLPLPGGGQQDVPEGSIVKLLTFGGALRAEARVGGDGQVDAQDYAVWRSNRGTSSALFEHDRVAPLLISVSVDGPTPIELLGTVEVCQLPASPQPVVLGQVWNGVDTAKWLADARSAYQWFRTNCAQQTVIVDSTSTLATVATAEWAKTRLNSAELGRIKVKFPWLPDREAVPFSSAHLALLAQPRGLSHEAHRFTNVAAGMQQTVGNDVAMEPLKLAAEALYLEAQSAPGPILNPLLALEQFLASESIHPDYAAAITTPLPELVNQLTLFRATVSPRPVLEITGELVKLNRGWSILTLSGDEYPLVGSASVAEILPQSTRLRLRPYDPGLFHAVPGSTVRVVGFPLAPASPLKAAVQPDLEVFSLEFIEVDLTEGAIDLDGDELEDAFEEYYFSTTAYGFWDDPDGDLFSIGEEFLAGTDPRNALSFPPGNPAFPQDRVLSWTPDGAVTLTWLGSSDAVYVVQNSASIGAWLDHPIAPVEVLPGQFEWSLPPPNPWPTGQFFRIAVSLQ